MILGVGAIGLWYPTTERGTRGNSGRPRKRKPRGESWREEVVIPSLSSPFSLRCPQDAYHLLLESPLPLAR